MDWWLTFAEQYNGTSLILEAGWSCPDAIIATDSCLHVSGAGGVFHRTPTSLEFFHYPTPTEVLHWDITTLELQGLVVALKLWAPLLHRQRLILLCDNTASVYTINTGRASSKLMQTLLRELWFLQGKYDCAIWAKHITSENNRLPDHLSRLYTTQALKHQKAFEQLTAHLQTTKLEITQDYFKLTVQPRLGSHESVCAKLT